MTSIQRILVPVDFSTHSQEALRRAVELAEHFGAKVDLLHCYSVSIGTISPYGIVVPADFEDKMRETAAAMLHDWREKAAVDGVEMKEHVSSRFPSEEIPSQASALGCDLIVMGTRGLTGLKHVMLGSVTERVVRTAPCAVLTVKAEEEAA